MAQTKKKKSYTRDEIFQHYMDNYVSHHGGFQDLSDFATASKIPIDQVLKHFETRDELDKAIWDELLINSVLTVENDPSFDQFTRREKMLSLYYTFFENLRLNRPFVVLHLDNFPSGKKRNHLFDEMKPTFLDFVERIVNEPDFFDTSSTLAKFKNVRITVIKEGFWKQMLFLISFWAKDTSSEFEKTDEAIEKSVTVAVDLTDTSRLKNMFDLGKFLWQERK